MVNTNEQVQQKQELINQQSNNETVKQSLKQSTTLKGKQRAMLTLKVTWIDGNSFTYRSDDALTKLTNEKGYKYIDQLDALVIIFGLKRQLIQEAQLFDNRKPQGEDLVMHYSGMIGKVLINNLPKKYKVY